ncbi:YbaB/EbfC family nucleoid-associated protein [Actinokineospora iranica]|uniref:Conserved DNA-binding protein YbaB n=1 Tax=Actinokineospora iranica TaxID=1271860 RepID=A0A1G6R1I8_9PSEU|nr:YbaB/EbfC family nucleoid-associated protein [Actinokineospora iranica]SDC97877.1 Conserved DNA-binding protein YbaB [Actinokineospora iranica]
MSGDDQASLHARNAAMKEQVHSLLDTFHRQTEMLRDAQAAAAQATASLTSKDGLVRVSVDASGMLTRLEFAPSAFERSTPETLARSALQLAREGAAKVKQQVADVMSPLTDGLPDLSDLVEGAPSLSGLLPQFSTPEPQPAAPVDEESYEDQSAVYRREESTPAAQPRRTPRPEPEDADEQPDSWLDRGRS